MREKLARAVIATLLAGVIWCVMAVQASAQERDCFKLDPYEPNAPRTVYVCGVEEEVSPAEIQDVLNEVLPELVACLQEHDKRYDVARLGHMRVVIVQEIVMMPLQGGLFVMGYYDWIDRVMYLKSWIPPDVKPSSLFKHELIHALLQQGGHGPIFEACSGLP